MNDGFEYRDRVDVDGEPLAEYLARRYAHSSRGDWRARIVAGEVLVDRERVDPVAIVRRGQSVVWRRPPWKEPEAPAGFAVLFEDDALLAVAKPAGLPVLPGSGFLQNTLLHRVRWYDAQAAPLHRLGRFTSGIVLFSKTRRARVEMGRQWAARAVGKRYRALASGKPAWRELAIDIPIGPVEHPLLGSLHAAAEGGKPASSRARVLEQRDDAFLCDVEIATGRPHQIRIHLAAAGHPLIGDPLYAAGGRPRGDAVPGDPGYLLHAAELSFRHPVDGRRLTLRCAPPPTLRRGFAT